jgi:metal-sulfur cluster biosynthetic enzyme
MSKPAKRAVSASVAPDYMMREARDREHRIRDLESVLSEERKSLNQLKQVTLPELFAQAGVDQLGLPAEGNNPAYDFKKRIHTHASIGADWDDDRRKEAFKVLEANGGKDLIKTEITVFIPAELRSIAKKVLAALKPFKGIEVETNLTVPWNTLTAFIKEATQKRGLILPLDKLGAQQGMIVEWKERKDGTTQEASSTGRNVAQARPEGTSRRKG